MSVNGEHGGGPTDAGATPPLGTWRLPTLAELRRKIEKIRAAHAGAQAGPQPVQPVLYLRHLPHHQPRAHDPDAAAGPVVRLESAVDGIETQAPHGGKAYLVEQRAADVAPESHALCEAFHAGLRTADSGLRRCLAETGLPAGVKPEDVIFLDLETTGLSATPVFLIGAMDWSDGGFVVRQYFARNYAEERAIISLFLEKLAGRRLLVSFNGKTFDLPYLRVRAAATGLPFQADLAHFDLLHACRRAWKADLPDCRLQTLESRVCGRSRHSDIAGHDIPEAYHAFVRTGDARVMVRVLRHNMLDLITLADLMLRLPGAGPNG